MVYFWYIKHPEPHAHTARYFDIPSPVQRQKEAKHIIQNRFGIDRHCE